jgi:hypothetical protein
VVGRIDPVADRIDPAEDHIGPVVADPGCSSHRKTFDLSMSLDDVDVGLRLGKVAGERGKNGL